MFDLKLLNLTVYFSPNFIDNFFASLDCEMSCLDYVIKAGERELGVNVAPVEPNVPYEKWEYSATVGFEIGLEIEHRMVVQRHGHGHIVEARSVALEIFDRVSVSVENKWIVVHLARGEGGVLEKIIIVGIHAGNHILSGVSGDEVHEHRFFSAGERLLGRKHNLEEYSLVFETAEHGSPEKYIVV